MRAERDFYKKLLDLGGQDAPEAFLEEALSLIIEVAGARRGYIEITGEDPARDQPRWWIARGYSNDEVETIRDGLSRGVMAETIATGRTIVTASARDDERFKKLKSVKKHGIEAVLCAPIGGPSPIGVVYLQDRIEPGPFSADDRLRAEVFARHLAPLADRLVMRHDRREEEDRTRPFRATLDVDRLVGRSAALARVLKDVRLVAARDVTVLLTGPTGSGKTDVARLIHDNGPRKDGPFVALNCANLSEQLATSLLFGHEKGAFTGADRRVEGQVAAADGGTLFLDEVAELPLATQAGLLKFLESKEYLPLAARHPSHANVRIIAATNADLDVAIEERRFRQDLFHRFDEFSIRIPSLAERREDIPDLMEHFLARECEAQRLRALRFSPGAIRAAEAAEWPGNIRELAKAVKKAALRAHDDGLVAVERQHLFPDNAATPSASGQGGRSSLQAAMRAYQGTYVREVLEETGWNVAATAKSLDVTRAHMYNLIKAHSIARKKP